MEACRPPCVVLKRVYGGYCVIVIVIVIVREPPSRWLSDELSLVANQPTNKPILARGGPLKLSRLPPWWWY
jgi:hypothetical protein